MRGCVIAIVLFSTLASQAQAQSVLVNAKPEQALPNATVSTQQELHSLKARFERQRARDLRRVGGGIEPVAVVEGERAILPPIEITAPEPSPPTLSDAARVKKGVDDAFGPERVRVGLGSGQQVINGTPLPGSVWAAWTNPGNIQFWLR